ncbi:RimK family alpha-L-glutamate ligase [Qipengyuania sp. NPDC077563]|uniref:ATP-grasp domain-containing protein n=1 Tax=Qipengyuania sp. NPDC077563 TaxID=3364497 RepID=UPI00384D2B24
MLAIHTKTGPFAAGWVAYCLEKGIPFKEVDCFSPNIVEEVSDCKALLWHWSHNDFAATIFARQLIASVQAMGLVVFPSIETCWHFDDKVGQKYLLEAVHAPFIPTSVFYDPSTALDWLKTAKMPLVWKLRGGAGSRNVHLVKTKRRARKIIQKSFQSGWHTSRLFTLSEKLRLARAKPSVKNIAGIMRGIGRVIVPHQAYRYQLPEKGYVYFQDYIPDNYYDIRIIVIGQRAFGIKRMVRDGDFRASGSGKIIYDKNQIPKQCIELAFETASQISSQSCAFDFVQIGGTWKIVELSYGFSLQGYLLCPGYWRSDLSWVPGKFRPEEFIIRDLLEECDYNT